MLTVIAGDIKCVSIVRYLKSLANFKYHARLINMKVMLRFSGDMTSNCSETCMVFAQLKDEFTLINCRF